MNPVYFSSGVPSNFYVAPIELYDGMRSRTRIFQTNEHYFQSAKVLCSQVSEFWLDGQHYGEYEAYDLIADAPTAKEAKRLGRLVPLGDESLRQWNAMDAMVTNARVQSRQISTT